MKFHIICNAYNAVPFVKEVDADDLSAVVADVDSIGVQFIPMFVFFPDEQKFYRVVKIDDGPTFLSDDADELLGIATPPEGFKRLGGPQTMETDA